MTNPFTANFLKPFPVRGAELAGTGAKIPPSTVPWWLAQIAYGQLRTVYAGDPKTLEQIAKDGGFGAMELLDLLNFGNGNGEKFLAGMRARHDRRIVAPSVVSEAAFDAIMRGKST